MTPGDRVLVFGGVSRTREPATILATETDHVRVVFDSDGRTARVLRTRCKAEAVLPVHHRLTAQPSTGRATLRLVPKSTRWTSPKYAAFVRTHPCCSCGATEGIEAAHYGPDSGTSRKASDVYLTAQCFRCHRHWHDRGTLPGRSRIESEALMVQSQRDLLAEWFMRGQPPEET